MDRALSGPAQPPVGRPARRSSIARLAWATGLLVLGIAAVGGVLLYLGPFSLDTEEVERDVAAQFEAREGVSVDLSCPRDMPVESGGFFDCRGRTADGESVVVTIRVADPQDDVDYFWTSRPA